MKRSFIVKIYAFLQNYFLIPKRYTMTLTHFYFMFSLDTTDLILILLYISNLLKALTRLSVESLDVNLLAILAKKWHRMFIICLVSAFCQYTKIWDMVSI
eukprot:NODE_827_length_3663_cov_1.497755.p6 type:complete len:100 gc:universal NODE_827_length_3663_cov_1.497755:2809-2510(-)